MNMPVSFTSRALEEIKQILEKKNIPPGYGLRVGINGGGCSGVSYVLGFDKQKDKDEVHEMEGIPVYIEKRHAMFLFGVQVDYEETEEGVGFTFGNMNDM